MGLRKQGDENEEGLAAELVALARDGDHRAFHDLVEIYRDRIYQVCWSLTRNPEDAADVMQDVFIRAYAALKSFKGKSKFGTWLHRIALNTSLDYLRKESRHKNHRVYGGEEEGALERALEAGRSEAATQRDTVFYQQLQAMINEAIERLPRRQKQVFVLRYYNHLELKEIAEVLQCGEGSVKRHLHRAQTRLREIIGEKGW